MVFCSTKNVTKAAAASKVRGGTEHFVYCACVVVCSSRS